MKLSLLSLIVGVAMSVSSMARAEVPAGFPRELHLYTAAFSATVISAHTDGEQGNLTFAIVCEAGIINSSSAVLLLPTAAGDLTTDTFRDGPSRTGRARSQTIPLSTDATVKICNNPNGQHILRYSATNGQLDYVSVNADSLNGNRGY